MLLGLVDVWFVMVLVVGVNDLFVLVLIFGLFLLVCWFVVVWMFVLVWVSWWFVLVVCLCGGCFC